MHGHYHVVKQTAEIREIDGKWVVAWPSKVVQHEHPDAPLGHGHYGLTGSVRGKLKSEAARDAWDTQVLQAVLKRKGLR